MNHRTIVSQIADRAQEAREDFHYNYLINWGLPWLLVSSLKDLPDFADTVLYKHKESSILEMFTRYGILYTLQQLNNEARIYLD